MLQHRSSLQTFTPIRPAKQPTSSTSPSASSKTSSQKSPKPQRKILEPSETAVRLKRDPKLAICMNCSKLLQNEAKLVESLKNLSDFLGSFNMSVQEWRKGRIERVEIVKFVDQSEVLIESGRKMKEVVKGIEELQELTVELVQEMKELVKKKKEKVGERAEFEDLEILDVVRKVKECVGGLKQRLIEESRLSENSEMLDLQLKQMYKEKKGSGILR